MKFIAAALLMLGAVAAQAAPDADAAVPAPAAGEQEVALPSYPKAEDLVEYYIDPTVRYRVFVDAPSVFVTEDGAVRFALVVKTEGGAVNASYDAIRCSSYERISYAFGGADGQWLRARNPHWQAIYASGVGGHYGALAKELLCSGEQPAGGAKDIVRALKASRNLGAR